MQVRPSGIRLGVAVVVGAVGFLQTAVARATEGPAALPTFAKIEQAVERHLASLPDYKPGDLLSRSQVEPVFDSLRKLGWAVADRQAILERVPADGNFLVRQFRTPAGRRFMRQIQGYPGAYDRLDRLARLPMGKDTVQALVRGPDGYKMIEYMTTTPGGSNLGKMLSDAPKGKNFNKPTGRIYTVKQLIAALRKSYDSAKQSAKPTP